MKGITRPDKVSAVTAWLRLTLLGTGAMDSPRYPPAGLLVRYHRQRVMIDGGPGAEPTGPLAAWLVSDERGELRAELRMLAAIHGVQPAAAATAIADLVIEPHPVVHRGGHVTGTKEATVAGRGVSLRRGT